MSIELYFFSGEIEDVFERYVFAICAYVSERSQTRGKLFRANELGLRIRIKNATNLGENQPFFASRWIKNRLISMNDLRPKLHTHNLCLLSFGIGPDEQVIVICQRFNKKIYK